MRTITEMIEMIGNFLTDVGNHPAMISAAAVGAVVYVICMAAVKVRKRSMREYRYGAGSDRAESKRGKHSVSSEYFRYIEHAQYRHRG